MLNEINDQAGQHEVIAENLSTAVVSDLSILVKSMRDDRRKVSSHVIRHHITLTGSLSHSVTQFSPSDSNERKESLPVCRPVCGECFKSLPENNRQLCCQYTNISTFNMRF